MKVERLLYDQLLTDPTLAPELKARLELCTVIDATHVSDYYYSPHCDLSGVLDIPNIAPPFESFFLEFRSPESWLHDADRPRRVGLFCRGAELSEEYRAYGWETLQMLDQGRIDIGQASEGVVRDPARIKAFMTRILQDARWELSFVLFMQLSGSRLQHIHGPFCRWEMFVGNDGRPINSSQHGLSLFDIPMGYIDSESLQFVHVMSDEIDHFRSQMKGMYGDALFPGLLAIAFMHCKNVVLKQQTPPKVEPTQKQKRWKQIPAQPVTYHVLEIAPMKHVLKTEGHAEKTGLQRALHICRGHFATYDEEHKLFGKYAGTFWKPQHIRGTAQAGVAVKDYRIGKV